MLPAFIAGMAVLIAPLLLVDNQRLQLAFAVLILSGWIAWFGRTVHKVGLAHFGMRPGWQQLGEFLVGVGIAVIAVAAMLASNGLFEGQTGFAWRPESLGMAMALFAFQMLLVGLWEEALFRGYFLRLVADAAMKKTSTRIAGMVAIALSSLTFALAHSATSAFSVAAFAFFVANGAVWCIPVLLTGRIGMAVGLHIGWNFAQSSLFGMRMSGNAPQAELLGAGMSAPTYWSGGAYGPEAGLAGALGLVVMLTLILLWHKARKPRRDAEAFPIA